MVTLLNSFDKLIFRLSCGLAALYELYILGMEFVLDLSVEYIIVDGSLFVFFSLLTILSYRFTDPITKLQIPFVTVLFLGIGYFWIQSGGLAGGNIGYTSMVVLITIILIPKPPFNYYSGALFFLLQCSLVLLEIFYPAVVSREQDIQLGFFPITFLILNLFVGVMISALRFLMEKDRVRIVENNLLLEQKNKEIKSKNSELEEHQSEIQRINKSLEKRVSERTQEILIQKQQIEEFTYLNAHKLRGAITRIVGLATLQKDESSEEENNRLREMIDQCAREADDVLKEITGKLNEESKKQLSKD